MNYFFKISTFFFMLAIFFSCRTSEKVIYLQSSDSIAYNVSGKFDASIPEPVIKIGDLLTITVNTTTPEAAMPFNLPLVPTDVMNNYDVSRTAVANYSGGLQNYVVSTDGTIVMPVIGRLQVAGLTKAKLAEKVKSTIYPKYVTEEPIILVRYSNFQVSVLGEVNKPGNFLVNHEKISIFEALAMAGDLTIYGRRDNILLVRETQNGRESVRVDLRNENLLNSPYYFLQQSDVLYIEPNKPKSRTSALSTAETLSISIIGTLISLSTLIVNITK